MKKKYFNKISSNICFSFILANPLNMEVYSEINNNSLLSMFCLENVKTEMINAKLKYEESFAKEICDCYIRTFLESSNHEESISTCKEIYKSKFNL